MGQNTAVEALESRRLLATTGIFSGSPGASYTGSGVTSSWTIGADTSSHYSQGCGLVVSGSSVTADNYTLNLSGLPAHSMVQFQVDEEAGPWHADNGSGTLKVTAGSSNQTTSYSNYDNPYSCSRDYSANFGKWFANSGSSLSITLSAESMTANCGYFVPEVTVAVYQPTVTVSGGGSTSEDSTTQSYFVISRDLPGGYLGISAGDDALPNTVVDAGVGGTASAGQDYSSNFPNGTTTIHYDILHAESGGSAAFSVTPVLDNEAESTDTIVLSIAGTNEYLVSWGASSATLSLLGVGHMTTTPTLAGFEDDPSAEGEMFGTTGTSGSVGFHVKIEAENFLGQTVSATGVTSEHFTLTVSGNASISNVTDSLGRQWTISGSTASLSINGPFVGLSFDVLIGLAVPNPGLVEVDLDASAVRGTATLHGYSSSGGRKIAAAANPGPVATPTKIYFINDSTAVRSHGHAAAIIPNGAGCTYYSYSLDGHVTTQTYNNVTDALNAAKAAHYDRYETWNVTAAKATAARNAAGAFDGTKDIISTHNCWTMVSAALAAAQTDAYTDDNDPNLAFIHNDPDHGGNAVDHGDIP